MNRILGLAIMLLILTTTFAYAGTIEGKSAFVNRQCETDKAFYSICADYDGTYNVDVIGPASKWVAFAPKTFTLNKGQCQELVLFVTPECYANSGTYDFNIVVLGAEKFEKKISLKVIQAHTQLLEVVPRANESKAGETNIYDIKVTNTSNYVGEFVLTTNNIPSSWVSLQGEPFVLAPYESREFELKITPNFSTNPSIVDFTLTASNTLTDSASTINLTQKIVDFVPFTIYGLPLDSLDSSEINSCSETGKQIEFTITNNSSHSDEYNLTFVGPDSAKLNKTTINLDTNESEKIILTIDKDDINSHFFGINVYSQKYRRTFDVSGIINIIDCYNISLERVSTNTSECLGDFEQQFIIRNHGLYDSNIYFDSEYLVGDFVTELESGKQKTIMLYMMADKLGTNNIVVQAVDNYSKTIIDYNIEVLDCISYDVNMVLKIETDCNIGELFPIEINNKSALDMTIDLNASGIDFINFSNNQINLLSGQKGNLYMYVPPSCGKEAGTYEAKIVFDNNKGLVKERIVEVVLVEGCVPKVELADETPMIREAIFDLNFYNDSNLPTEVYNITIEGFDFKSNFQPSTLQPFEEQIISFEIILPDGFKEKIVDLNIIVSTSLGEIPLNKKVLVTNKPMPLMGLFALGEGVGIISLILLLILIALVIYAVAPKGKNNTVKSEKILAKKPTEKTTVVAKTKGVNKKVTDTGNASKAKPSAQKSIKAKV
jgi:hypothetical protein